MKRRFDGGGKAEKRLEVVNNHFSAVNIASIAVLTSLGVSYMLDSIKEKRDATLREEIKSRVVDGMRDSGDRISRLEQSVADLKAKVCDSEEVEEIVAKRFE